MSQPRRGKTLDSKACACLPERSPTVGMHSPLKTERTIKIAAASFETAARFA
jgi:hypothetical protein